MKDKKCRKSRDARVILGYSMTKDVKGWELTDQSNKVVVKSFRGATTSQWRASKTNYGTKSQKYNFLHCGTNDINDEFEPQNIAEEIVNSSN